MSTVVVEMLCYDPHFSVLIPIPGLWVWADIIIITSAKEVVFFPGVCIFVCLFVCLSVSKITLNCW